jgi:hypothetical protein
MTNNSYPSLSFVLALIFIYAKIHLDVGKYFTLVIPWINLIFIHIGFYPLLLFLIIQSVWGGML